MDCVTNECGAGELTVNLGQVSRRKNNASQLSPQSVRLSHKGMGTARMDKPVHLLFQVTPNEHK